MCVCSIISITVIVLVDQTKKIFECFICFLEVICITYSFESFSLKAKFFVLKKLVFGNFATHLASGLSLNLVAR